MAAWRYDISLLVLKKYFSTLEEKFRIPAQPFNILYILSPFQKACSWLFKYSLSQGSRKKLVFKPVLFASSSHILLAEAAPCSSLIICYRMTCLYP